MRTHPTVSRNVPDEADLSLLEPDELEVENAAKNILTSPVQDHRSSNDIDQAFDI